MKASHARAMSLFATMCSAAGLASLPASARAAEMNILAPSYYGNSGDDPAAWSNLQSYWPTNGSNGMIIVNPDNGVGTAVDNTLLNNIAALKYGDNWQPHFLAYVDLPEAYDSNHNQIPGFDSSEKTKEIDNWVAWYGGLIDGFFFDDVAREGSGATSFDLSHIEYVVSYAIGQYKPPIVVMNAAGAYSTTAGLYYCVGNTVQSNHSQFIVVTVETYEDKARSGSQSDIHTHGADFAAGGPLHWVYGYPASTFGGLVHDGSASAVFSDLQILASYNIASTFVTDMPEVPNPWDPGPSHDVWTDLASDTGSATSWTFPGGTSGGLSVLCPPPHSYP